MALSRNELIAKLRTMQDRASKAPMQGVKLPTNQSSYRTPSGPAASAPQPQQAKGTDPVTLAKAGSALGGAAKAWANRNVSPYDWNAVSNMGTSAYNLAPNAGELGGLLGMMQGSNVDVAANMAGNTAGNMANLPVPSMLGSGVPVDGFSSLPGVGGDLTLQNGGMLGSAALQGADAASAGADAASGVASSVPVGSFLGAGLSAAGGNYGKAAGQVAGGTAGSFFGPAGTFIGSTVGGFLGGLFD